MANRKKALILSGGGARGAYQAGVIQYLEEINFRPDIISGTSVGAINSVALGSGLNSRDLIDLWTRIETDSVYKYSIWRTLWNLITRKYSPIADTTPLRRLLETHIDLNKLHFAEQKIFISAVDILSAELKYFTNKEISYPHILASSAIPLVFPWQYINGVPHWDGGLMANTPIQPAIEEGAREIIVVLLSPVGRKIDLGMPRTKKDSIERVFELSLIGSYQLVDIFLKKERERAKQMSPIESFLYSFGNQYKNIRIRTVGPSEPLGLGSIMNFSAKRAKNLIDRGYRDARAQLGLEKYPEK
jgi:NTE family protein